MVRASTITARGAGARPPFSPPAGGQGGDCMVRASTITARGAGARPPFPPLRGGRGGARRSWTSVAKTPAFSQRWVC